MHLVVTCKSEEYADTIHVIRDEISPGKRIPVERQRNGDVKLRFNIRYLERLMLCIPFAQVSTGIEKRLFQAELERLLAMPVPDFFVQGMKGELWEHQAVAAEFLAEETGELLLDEMGAGKTKAILAAIISKNWFPALVAVGSVSAKWVWQRELDRWFPDVSYTVVDGPASARERQLKEDTQIKIVNVQGLRVKRERNKEKNTIETTYVANPGIFEIPWEVFVCDEFHRLKNPGAQQTAGFLAVECGRFIGASGTPIMNKPEDAWSFLNKCDPERYPTYYHFEQQIGKFSKAGKLIGYNPDEMLKVKAWLGNHALRRRKEHIVAILREHGHDADLPEVIYSEQVVELTPEQRRLYDRIKKEAALEFADGTVKTNLQVLTIVLRLKQACFSPELYGGSQESAKINQIKEDVAELVASGEKAIIFSEWAQAARILQRELAQYNPAYVDGSVKGTDRNEEIRRFNEDPDCKLYIGTIRANQEAITLNAATYVLFADEEWSPLANEQAAARSAAGGMRGLGITVPVNIIRYRGENTIEERVAKVLERKKNLFNATIERDSGRRANINLIRAIRDIL